MSGYNPDTGIFELTATKAAYWLRRSDIPAECDGLQGMEFYAALFRSCGYDVPLVKAHWLQVKATPGQVWIALSGQPSDPSHERYYEGRPRRPDSSGPSPKRGSRLFTAAEAATFRNGLDGLGRPTVRQAATGLAKCRVCGEKIAKGEECVAGDFDFYGNPKQPTRCYVHLSCPPEGDAGDGYS